MSVTLVQQKPNYCFVACMASMLIDEGKALKDCDYYQLQESIVDRFPDDLYKGTEYQGNPKEPRNMGNVLTGLGLANDFLFTLNNGTNLTTVKEYLNSHRERATKMLLSVTSTHITRISEISDRGIQIIDPERNEPVDIEWSDFENHYYALIELV